MKLSRVERSAGTVEYGLIYGSIVLFILVSVRISELFPDIPKALSGFSCTFKNITHIPCLTCGMTRSIFSLVHLNIIDAFRMNPLVFLTILILLLWGVWSLIGVIVKPKRIRIELAPAERIIVILSVILLVIANWLYLIWAGR